MTQCCTVGPCPHNVIDDVCEMCTWENGLRHEAKTKRDDARYTDALRTWLRGQLQLSYERHIHTAQVPVMSREWVQVACPVCGSNWHLRYKGEELTPCGQCYWSARAALAAGLIMAGAQALRPHERVLEVHPTRNGPTLMVGVLEAEE